MNTTPITDREREIFRQGLMYGADDRIPAVTWTDETVDATIRLLEES